MVYVQNIRGEPLMPTGRHGKVKHLLNQGRAELVAAKPYTIRLLYETKNRTQPVTVGVDSGYLHMGISAVTETAELISGNVALLRDMSKRISKRAMYRSSRRNRLRYRKNNGKNEYKPKGWLAPSIQHKLDSQVRFVTDKLSRILPISKVKVEVAAFDIQKIKNPGIQGTEYQQGEQHGHRNVREYVLYRDGHKCQNPDCKSKKLTQPKGEGKISKIPLVAHHIEYRKDDGTMRPGNLVTLCIQCHSAPNHLGFLKDWKPERKGFKAEAFMTAVRWKILDAFKSAFGEANVSYTYGYITKADREALGLDMTFANNAYCIAGGTKQIRSRPLEYIQTRRNNRCLEKFYDAKYTDTRTGKTVKAGELNSGRSCRNKNYNGENLRPLRGKKLNAGHRSIRRKRYPFQPGDLVHFEGKIYAVKGTHSYGRRVALKGLEKPTKADMLTPYRYGKGFACVS